MIFCVLCREWFPFWPRHHHHHHKAPPSAPTLAGITFTLKDSSMAPIVGTVLASVTLTLTLPTTRKDTTALDLTEISTATILRDAGSGPALLQVIPGPFTTGTVVATDSAPATGSDTYSFFVNDTQTPSVQGDTSASVSVTLTGAPVLAPASAGTLTAVVTPVTPVTTGP